MVVAHRPECARVHGAITQEFVDSTVVLVRARARDDVDLPATSTAHVGCVAAGFDLEFHHCVGRGA